MLRMTLTGPRLRDCVHPGLRDKVVYGLASPFQVSPTQAAMVLNLRVRGAGVVDFEAGNDVLVFDRLDAIRAEAAEPLDRSEPAVDPENGERITLVKYPPAVGFVPLGAKLPDGRPHPHAGTGFGLGQSLGYPVDRHVAQPYLQSRIVTLFDLYQFAFDGRRFTITARERFTPDALLPGWKLHNRPINSAVADDEELLLGLVAARDGGLHGSGLSRWRRGPDGWRPASFTPITPPDTSFEPSVARDTDGSLLFTARGWGIEGVSKEAVEKLDRALLNCLIAWRSTDHGATWRKLFQVDKARPWSPVVLNQTAAGEPYFAANPTAEPWPEVRGNTVPDARMRQVLSLWPVNAARSGVGDPVPVLDAVARFGKSPSNLTWYIDHPIGAVLTLADGLKHALLAFRVCDGGEVVRDAKPTEHTGTWVEEITDLS
ncbi:MAG: hypothetical protein K8S99_11340 [Planctomycetes bacterium]|nr:hypothetical protein [Planctomycetota bacterium]